MAHGRSSPMEAWPSSQQSMETDEDPSGVLKMENLSRLLEEVEHIRKMYDPAKEELKQLQDKKADSGYGRQNMKKLNDELKSCKEMLSKVTEERNRLKKEKERQQRTYEEISQQLTKKTDEDKLKIETLEQQNEIQKHNVRVLAEDVHSLREELKKQQENEKISRKEKTSLTEELSQCKSRLSRIMGSKLTDNNPAIADLSDQNRPTKIAERFKELYDNQWTDAFEALETTINDDKKKIDALLGLLKNIQEYCEKKSKEQSDELLRVAKLSRSMNYTEKKEPPPADVLKHIKEFRKGVAAYSLEDLVASYLREAGRAFGLDRALRSKMYDQKLQSFVKECVELCWLMLLQEPPVVIGEHSRTGDDFDANTYKPYTQTGIKFEYLVWPPLYLYQGGQLLEKGVAQATGKPTERDRLKKSTASFDSECAHKNMIPVQPGDTVHDNNIRIKEKRGHNMSRNAETDAVSSNYYFDNSQSTQGMDYHQQQDYGNRQQTASQGPIDWLMSKFSTNVANSNLTTTAAITPTTSITQQGTVSGSVSRASGTRLYSAVAQPQPHLSQQKPSTPSNQSIYYAYPTTEKLELFNKYVSYGRLKEARNFMGEQLFKDCYKFRFGQSPPPPDK